MSSNVTLNGVQYVVPAYNDTGWAQGAGNLSLYLAAIASATLQPTGGSFTLTADVDFGSNFGLKALFLKTETANPASAGVIRLASADLINWRNNANGADISLSKDTSDNLKWNATKVLLSGAVVNADINAAAAIAYSKLALTGSIVNADIGASAAIAYSKLALTGAILNADLAGSIAYSKLSLTGAILNADLAGSIAYSKLSLTGAILNADLAGSIALSKLVALGTGKALQSNASTGAIEVSAVTNTELGYVSGVTSAIQTQLNAVVITQGTYVPTITGAGTVANNTGFYQRIGNMVHVWGTFQSGTVSGSNVSISLPVGSLVYTNRLNTNGACFLGWMNPMYLARNVASNSLGILFADGTDTAAVYFTQVAPASGTAAWPKEAGTSALVSSSYNSYDFWYATA